MTFDAPTVTVLMLAAALGGVLLGVLPEWRRLMGGTLPVRKHWRSETEGPPFEAELRCALCSGREKCAARGQWHRRVHDFIGEHAYCAPAFRLSATPGEVTSAAPTLGRDNEAVFRGLLGLTAEEYSAFEAAGAFA